MESKPGVVLLLFPSHGPAHWVVCAGWCVQPAGRGSSVHVLAVTPSLAVPLHMHRHTSSPSSTCRAMLCALCRLTKKSKGFALIQFASPEDAVQASWVAGQEQKSERGRKPARQPRLQGWPALLLLSSLGARMSLGWRTMRLRGVFAGLHGCGCGRLAGQPVQREHTLHLLELHRSLGLLSVLCMLRRRTPSWTAASSWAGCCTSCPASARRRRPRRRRARTGRVVHRRRAATR